MALFESRIGSVGLSDVGAAIGAVSLRVSRIGLVAKPRPCCEAGALAFLRGRGLVAELWSRCVAIAESPLMKAGVGSALLPGGAVESGRV